VSKGLKPQIFKNITAEIAGSAELFYQTLRSFHFCGEFFIIGFLRVLVEFDLNDP